MLDTILLCLKAVIVALTLKRKMDVFYSIKTFLIIPLKIESYRFALVTLFLYISANVHFCISNCIQFYLQLTLLLIIIVNYCMVSTLL